MDYVAFLTRYPEFSTVDTSVITAVLTEVAFSLDSTIYLNRFPSAQAALAAHRLWMSPAGVSLRGDGASSDMSPYLELYRQIRRECTVGFMVL